jgi:hypothetical protein
MDTSCNIDPGQIFTLQELTDNYPGGVIQAIDELPNLKDPSDLDPKWIQQTIETLIRNKVIPKLIRPKTPNSVSPPPLPPPPPEVPKGPMAPTECGNYGNPSSDGNTRLYTQAECDSLGGDFNANGECMKKTGGSFSWDCRNLNRKDTCGNVIKNDGCGNYGYPANNSENVRLYTSDECTKMGGVWKSWAMCYKNDNITPSESYSVKCAYLNNSTPDAKKKYEQELTNYQDALQSITNNKTQYNNDVTEYNKKIDMLKKSMNKEYCFFNTRLLYGQSTFIKTTSNPEVPENNKMVNYKYELIQKLKLKKYILIKIGEQVLKSVIPLLEGFKGSMPRSDSDLRSQHNTLTHELTASKLNKRMVEYTLEKNKANQNLLTLFGVLNVVAVGIIYGIASS